MVVGQRRYASPFAVGKIERPELFFDVPIALWLYLSLTLFEPRIYTRFYSAR